MQRRLLACSAAAGFAAAALLIVGILGPAVVDRALDKAVDEYTIIDGPSAGAFKTFKHDDTKYRDFYMLNVTNPEEVVAGALPRLREVGPFRYVWHEQHLNITWQPEQDTLTSYVRTYYTFVSAPEGMTEHTRFTVPNLPFYAVYVRGAVGSVRASPPAWPTRRREHTATLTAARSPFACDCVPAPRRAAQRHGADGLYVPHDHAGHAAAGIERHAGHGRPAHHV